MKPRKGRTSQSDALCGRRIREVRESLQLSQDALASSLVPPVTPQQMQNYEKGRHRVSASYLKQIAAMTGKTMEWFFVEEG